MRFHHDTPRSASCKWRVGWLCLAACLLWSCGKREQPSTPPSPETKPSAQPSDTARLTNAPAASAGSEIRSPRQDTSAPPAPVQTTNAVLSEAEMAEREKALNLYNQGVRHFLGDGIPRSPSEAAKLFLQAAELGNPGAQHNLGVLYLTGNGVATNDASEAARWFTKSAERGLAESQLKLAGLYASGIGVTQDINQAIQWVRKAADQGHPEAEYNLATMYFSGRGVTQDIAEAVRWYRKAAEKGQVLAQSNLGVLYAKGQGVPQDDKEAVHWFRKAAEQGYPFAQFNLARAYVEGKVVEQNFVEAYKWFFLAAEQGDRDAAKERVELSLKMSYAAMSDAIRQANAFAARLMADLTNRVQSFPTNLTATGQPAEKEQPKLPRE